MAGCQSQNLSLQATFMWHIFYYISQKHDLDTLNFYVQGLSLTAHKQVARIHNFMTFFISQIFIGVFSTMISQQNLTKPNLTLLQSTLSNIS